MGHTYIHTHHFSGHVSWWTFVSQLPSWNEGLVVMFYGLDALLKSNQQEYTVGFSFSISTTNPDVEEESLLFASTPLMVPQPFWFLGSLQRMNEWMNVHDLSDAVTAKLLQGHCTIRNNIYDVVSQCRLQHARKRNVFSCWQNSANECADLTLVGRLFQARAAAKAKE